MNNNGFMMAEVVVVSSIVLVTLVGLYSSYNKILRIYNQRINYYDVSTLYELATIRSKIDFSGTTPSEEDTVYNSDGRVVYYVNADKYVLNSMSVEHVTFSEYLEFLSTSLDTNELGESGVSNILVMEKCKDKDSDGIYEENCRYAYLEVFDEAS